MCGLETQAFQVPQVQIEGDSAGLHTLVGPGLTMHEEVPHLHTFDEPIG